MGAALKEKLTADIAGLKRRETALEETIREIQAELKGLGTLRHYAMDILADLEKATANQPGLICVSCHDPITGEAHGHGSEIYCPGCFEAAKKTFGFVEKEAPAYPAPVKCKHGNLAWSTAGDCGPDCPPSVASQLIKAIESETIKDRGEMRPVVIRELLSINPEAGLEAAEFALTEAEAGNMLSIVQRFNVPDMAMADAAARNGFKAPADLYYIINEAIHQVKLARNSEAFKKVPAPYDELVSTEAAAAPAEPLPPIKAVPCPWADDPNANCSCGYCQLIEEGEAHKKREAEITAHALEAKAKAEAEARERRNARKREARAKAKEEKAKAAKAGGPQVPNAQPA